MAMAFLRCLTESGKARHAALNSFPVQANAETRHEIFRVFFLKCSFAFGVVRLEIGRLLTCFSPREEIEIFCKVEGLSSKRNVELEGLIFFYWFLVSIFAFRLEYVFILSGIRLAIGPRRELARLTMLLKTSMFQGCGA